MSKAYKCINMLSLKHHFYTFHFKKRQIFETRKETSSHGMLVIFYYFAFILILIIACPKRYKPSFPPETFPMGYNQHKPKDNAGIKTGMLLRCDILFPLDILHENSFLPCLLCRLGHLCLSLLLLNRLDDTNSHSLPHVTHGKTS